MELSGDKISIETPEQVHLEFPLAGVGSRFLAIATDTVYQVLAGIVFVLSLTIFATAFLDRVGSTWTTAIEVFGVFLIHFCYFAFFEIIWQGQTPGKRQQNLRVIKDDGRPITAFDSIGRNLLRIVDSLPGMYAVGIVSVLLSGQNKRLGDYLAGTIVVHDKPLDRGSSLSFRSGDEPLERPVSGAGVRLSDAQFQLLEAYTVRKYDMEWAMREKFAHQIVERLATDIEIGEEDRRNPDSLIERLVKEHRNR
jgi:uncharacterized RDD family membrane protein YckC